MADQAGKLLAELETATYHQRTARVVALGRDANARVVLRQLYDLHGFHGKQLALLACYGSRDVDIAVESLSCTSRNIRELGLRILLDIAPDDTLITVLSGFSCCQLKHVLRRMYKAGNRTAVLEHLVEQAAITADREQLEAVIVYGSANQVVKYWPLVERQASSLTWGMLANYFPEYTADRIAAWTSKAGQSSRANKLSLVKQYLLLHCPQRVWDIVKDLPQEELASAELGLYVDKFPSNMVDMLMKPKASEQAERKPIQEQAVPKKQKIEGEPAAAAAAASAAVPESVAPAAPPVYQTVLREPFLAPGNVSSSFKAHLLRRVHHITDDQLLQVVNLGVLQVSPLLRVLPYERRAALYEAWKQQWLRQHARLQALKQRTLENTTEVSTWKLLAGSTEEAAFQVWANPQDRNCHLPKWLPAKLAADFIDLLIRTAPEFYAKYPHATVARWLINLPDDEFHPLLSKHVNLLDVLQDWAQQLMDKLTWQQQLDLHRLRRQQRVQLYDVAVAAASQSAEATMAALKLTSPFSASDLLTLGPQVSSADVTPSLRHMLAEMPVSTRGMLLRASHVCLMGEDPNPAARPYGLKLTGDAAAALLVGTKPEALAAIFDDWQTWLRATSAQMADVQQQYLQGTQQHQAPAWDHQVFTLTFKVLHRAAAAGAFSPWLSGRVLAKAWFALPSGSAAAAADAAAPPRLAFLRALHSAGGQYLETALTEVAGAMGSSVVRAVAPSRLLLEPEADEMAKLHPELFLKNPAFLALLPGSSQIQLLESWSRRQACLEQELQQLLEEEPARGMSRPSLGHAKALLLSSNLVASGALKHLEPQARALLFQACRHAWLSDWGSVDVAELPEPQRTEVVKIKLDAIIKDHEEPWRAFSQAEGLLPWLTWQEMLEHPALREKLLGKGSTDRLDGLVFLFKAAGMQPAHVPMLLELVHQRRREQDTVRQALLEQLRKLLQTLVEREDAQSALVAAGVSQAAAGSGAVTVESQLPAIQVLIDDALSAKDLSNSSLQKVFSILMLLLTRFQAWACAALAHSVAVYGMQALVLDRLDGDVRAHMDALMLKWEPAKKGAPALGTPAAEPGTTVAARYNPALEEFLLHMAKGLRAVQESLKLRQDGAVGMLQLLQRQWDWGKHAEKSHQALLLEKGSSPLRQALLQLAQEAAQALQGKACTELITNNKKQVQFLVELLLTHLPDTFLQVRHLALPTEPEEGIAFTSFAVNIVDVVPTQRLDLLMPFINENSTMPAVAAKAVKLLFKHHRDKLGTLVPQLLARDLSFACLPHVLHFMHNERQDLLQPLLGVTQVQEGMFKNGAPASATAIKGAGARKVRTGRGRRDAPREGGGWSRRAHQISYWLGLPQLASQWKWTAEQQHQLALTLVSVLYRGTISLKDVKNLVNRIALLPAAPPSLLLGLLDDPTPADEPAAAEAVQAPLQRELPEAVRTLVKDSVMTALVRLDDSQQAWAALVESVRVGTSTTALAAVGALLTSTNGWATKGRIEEVLDRLRSLPWQRPAVMKEVVRVLGKLADNEPMAFAELASIMARDNLQRSVQQQLLTTLQGFVHTPEVQAFFMRSAQSKDADVAKAAAFVPTHAVQKSPGVVAHTVALFELLLAHPELRVKLEAMRVWSDSSTPIQIDRGMPVLTKMMAVGEQLESKQKQTVIAQARGYASKWFQNVVNSTQWKGNALETTPSFSSIGPSDEYEMISKASSMMEDEDL